MADKDKRRQAWALEYHELVPAPIVIARGQGWQADVMERMANDAGIPVVADPGLAAGLDAVHLGQAIPESCYRAVAALYRFVYERQALELRTSDEKPAGK
jgi:type III secretion system FlhB-like substrate exporter